MGSKYIPMTPAGTFCTWLEADTREGAIENLLRDVAGMYERWSDLRKRGYSIEKMRPSRRSLHPQTSEGRRKP